jgi:hypothetical protein
LDDYSGSMRPCPEGVYDLGKVDDLGYDPGSSDGFGQYVIPLLPRANIQRSELLAHADRNRSTSPGCFDIEDTFVLTSEGWVSAHDVTQEMSVAQLSDNFKVIFGQPKRVVREEYDGEMVLLSSNKIEMLVTPNHRICKTSTKAIKPWSEEAPRVSYVSAQDLYDSNKSVRIPLSGIFMDSDETFILPDWKAKLLIERLEELFKEGGLNYKKKQLSDGSYVLKVDELPFKKEIAPEIALHIPLKTRVLMLKELIHWDGTKSSSKSSEKYCVNLCTKNKSQADFYEMLAITSGFGCARSMVYDSRNESWSPLHRLNIVEGRISTGLERPEYDGSLEVSLQPFSGTVFCLETETTNFFVRHRGRVFVSGNSAGCCCPFNPENMLKIVGWMRQQSAPKYLIVDHGLGFLKQEGVDVPALGKA